MFYWNYVMRRISTYGFKLWISRSPSVCVWIEAISPLNCYHAIKPYIMHCQLINTLYINYLSFVKNQLPTNFTIFTLCKNFMRLNEWICVACVNVLLQQGLFDRKLLVRKLPSAYDERHRDSGSVQNDFHISSYHWMVSNQDERRERSWNCHWRIMLHTFKW